MRESKLALVNSTGRPTVAPMALARSTDRPAGVVPSSPKNCCGAYPNVDTTRMTPRSLTACGTRALASALTFGVGISVAQAEPATQPISAAAARLRTALAPNTNREKCTTLSPPFQRSRRIPSTLGLSDPINAQYCVVSNTVKRFVVFEIIVSEALHTLKSGSRGARKNTTNSHPEPSKSRQMADFRSDAQTRWTGMSNATANGVPEKMPTGPRRSIYSVVCTIRMADAVRRGVRRTGRRKTPRAPSCPWPIRISRNAASWTSAACSRSTRARCRAHRRDS